MLQKLMVTVKGVDVKNKTIESFPTAKQTGK